MFVLDLPLRNDHFLRIDLRFRGGPLFALFKPNPAELQGIEQIYPRPCLCLRNSDHPIASFFGESPCPACRRPFCLENESNSSTQNGQELPSVPSGYRHETYHSVVCHRHAPLHDKLLLRARGGILWVWVQYHSPDRAPVESGNVFFHRPSWGRFPALSGRQ